ncbi:septation regulator SpoVG [bacterium]|nr:septation regulator SpoVG [bacterium]MBU1752591.1 septation regulator SpoVG [bacterium]
MEVTSIRVKKVENDSKLKAWASITFDEAFVVHNVKVIQGQDAIFIAMPNRLTRNGVFKDIAHPITADFRDMLQSKVLDAYNNTNGDNHEDDSFNW